MKEGDGSAPNQMPPRDRPNGHVYLSAALLGAVVTVAPLSVFGWPVALLGAAFGASALAVVVAVAAAVVRFREERWGVLTSTRVF